MEWHLQVSGKNVQGVKLKISPYLKKSAARQREFTKKTVKWTGKERDKKMTNTRQQPNIMVVINGYWWSLWWLMVIMVGRRWYTY